jgi:hypothetical protein
MQEVRALLKAKVELFENSLSDLDAERKKAILTALTALLSEFAPSADNLFGERRPNAAQVAREQEIQWIVNRLRLI